MDLFGSVPIPSLSGVRSMALLLLAGLLASGLGLALGRGFLIGVGMVVAAAGAAGLWWLAEASQRGARKEHAILVELNESLDEQIQGRTQRLMQTIEDMESFNRMVTHDLRSPLSGLILGIDLLENDLLEKPDGVLQARVKTIADCAQRMQELVQDLRQLAMISGRAPVIQQVDLSHHAALILRQLAQKETHRKAQWKIEPRLVVYGDPNLLRIALENLLGNAWKYTLDRNPAEIVVRRGQGEGVVLEIQDNGTGFDMAKADRLFQPFQRMHEDARYPGHGIGLSIVKRVMTRHNGDISAVSAPGKGATFRLFFPAEPGSRGV